MFNFNCERVEFFLPAFGDHLPDVPAAIPTVLKTYPMYTMCEGGFDLEYSSLLIADCMIVDKNAFEFVVNSKRPYFKSMANTLKRLLEAGFLRLEDYRTHAESIQEVVLDYVNSQLEDPVIWLDILQRAIRHHEHFIKEQLQVFGSDANTEIEQIPFGVLSYMIKAHGRVDFNELRRVEKIINSERRSFSRMEEEVVREVVRPLLTQAVFDKKLGDKMGMPFIDWPDIQLFHESIPSVLEVPPKKSKIKMDHLEACRKLFAITIPNLKPKSVDKVIKFLEKSNARKSLRSELRLALSEGRQPDQKWIDGIRDDANLAQMVSREREKKRKLWFFGISVIPFIGPKLAIAKEVLEAGHLIKDVVEVGADKVAEKKSLSRYEWYFALLKHKEQ